jgi:hypothetical protein
MLGAGATTVLFPISIMSSSETALLELATKDDGRDILALSDKERMILQLYDQIQEQELEIALLEQGTRYSCESEAAMAKY